MTDPTADRPTTYQYESIVERLSAIEEELQDLAYGQLAETARRPDSDEGIAAAAEEKRLLKARRSIAKAIHTLSPAPADLD